MLNSDSHNHPPKITLVLVDDSRSYQLALERYLSELFNIVLVAKAATGHEALRLPDSLQPDIVVLDLYLPDRFGVTLIAPLREKWPSQPDSFRTLWRRSASITCRSTRRTGSA